MFEFSEAMRAYGARDGTARVYRLLAYARGWEEERSNPLGGGP